VILDSRSGRSFDNANEASCSIYTMANPTCCSKIAMDHAAFTSMGELSLYGPLNTAALTPTPSAVRKAVN